LHTGLVFSLTDFSCALEISIGPRVRKSVNIQLTEKFRRSGVHVYIIIFAYIKVDNACSLFSEKLTNKCLVCFYLQAVEITINR